MPSLAEMTDMIRAGIGGNSGLGKSLKFDLRGEGVIHIDGGAVTNSDDPADLVISISKADLEALGKGRLDPMTAVIKGRMRMSDMGLAMSLQPQMRALFSKLI